MVKRGGNTVRAMVYRLGQPGKVEDILDELETYRTIVGGDIEGWSLPFNRKLYIYCHGEGLYILPPNRYIEGLGRIHGDFVVTRIGRAGESVSLTDADIAQLGTEIG